MKIKAKANIHTDNIVGGGMFHAIRGQVHDDVEPTLAKRLIKDDLAVEYKPEQAKPKPASPAVKTVQIQAIGNILRTDPHVYLQKGQVGQVGEDTAAELVKLKLARVVKTAKPEPIAV